jgi:hypothetical protein
MLINCVNWHMVPDIWYLIVFGKETQRSVIGWKHETGGSHNRGNSDHGRSQLWKVSVFLSKGKYRDCLTHESIKKTFSLLMCTYGVSGTSSVVQWSEFLAADPEVRVRFPALPDFLRSRGYGKRSTQPRDYNWGTAWKKRLRLRSRNPGIQP